MVLPLLPFYAEALHATPKTIGWIIASFSIAQLVSAPLWGRVSDRYGRRPGAADRADGLGHRVRRLRAGAHRGAAVPLARWSRGRAAARPAWRRPTWPTRSRPRAARAPSGWLSAATSLGVMIGPVIGSLAAHWGRAAPGLRGGHALPGERGLRVALPAGVAGAPGEHTPTRKPVWHAAWQILRRPGTTVRAARVDLRRGHARLHLPDVGAAALPGRRIRRHGEDDRLLLPLRRRALPRDAIGVSRPDRGPGRARPGPCAPGAPA